MIADGAGEFRRAFTDLFIPRATTSPGRSETNGVAECNMQSLSFFARFWSNQDLNTSSGPMLPAQPPSPLTSARMLVESRLGNGGVGRSGSVRMSCVFHAVADRQEKYGQACGQSQAGDFPWLGAPAWPFVEA
eukprot:9441967-Alexandrium_andersonii.AAC.1